MSEKNEKVRLVCKVAGRENYVSDPQTRRAAELTIANIDRMQTCTGEHTLIPVKEQ